MQQINKYFYKVAVSRVQTRFTVRDRKVLLMRYGRSSLIKSVVEVTAKESMDFAESNITVHRSSFESSNWVSVQVGDKGIFQVAPGAD